jgi:hypothetical protein
MKPFAAVGAKMKVLSCASHEFDDKEDATRHVLYAWTEEGV